MNDFDEPSIGVYGYCWEYKRGNHRRLINGNYFSREEALEIGMDIEGVRNKGKISIGNMNIYIHQDGIFTPSNQP